MKSVDQLTSEELEKILGGTKDETFDLCLALMQKYGALAFLHDKDTYQGGYLIDMNKVYKFFSDRGYKFIQGYGDKDQNYFEKDGLRYGNDYIIELLRTDQL